MLAPCPLDPEFPKERLPQVEIRWSGLSLASCWWWSTPWSHLQIRTDHHLLSRRQLPSVWLVNKTRLMCRIFVVFSFKDREISKHALHSTRKQTWIRTAGQKCSDEVRLIFHIPQSLCDLHLPAFLRGQSPFIFLNLQSNTSCCQIHRHNHLPALRIKALIPGFLQECWKWTTTIWKTVNSLGKSAAIKTFDPSASGTKMQIICYHHRVGSCNVNQSRAEALSVTCSRAAGEGGRGLQAQGLKGSRDPRALPVRSRWCPALRENKQSSKSLIRSSKSMRYWPILSRKPRQKPMVLNMADISKCRKSLQTPWNASYILADGFLTVCGIARVDFGWIRKGPKSTDFEHKAWAHGFEYGGFW